MRQRPREDVSWSTSALPASGEEYLGNAEQSCQALARHAAGPGAPAGCAPCGSGGMHSQRLCGTIAFALPMRFLCSPALVCCGNVLLYHDHGLGPSREYPDALYALLHDLRLDGSRLRLQVYAASQDMHGLGNIRTASWVGPVRRSKHP